MKDTIRLKICDNKTGESILDIVLYDENVNIEKLYEVVMGQNVKDKSRKYIWHKVRWHRVENALNSLAFKKQNSYSVVCKELAKLLKELAKLNNRLVLYLGY